MISNYIIESILIKYLNCHFGTSSRQHIPQFAYCIDGLPTGLAYTECKPSIEYGRNENGTQLHLVWPHRR